MGTHTNTHAYTLSPSTLAHLLLQEESHAVAHLVSVDGGEGDVEEEAVQDGFGDPLQRNGQQQQRHADEDVGSQRRQPGLLHLDDAEEEQNDTHNERTKDFWKIISGKTTENLFLGIFPISFIAGFAAVQFRFS